MQSEFIGIKIDAIESLRQTVKGSRQKQRIKMKWFNKKFSEACQLCEVVCCQNANNINNVDKWIFTRQYKQNKFIYQQAKKETLQRV